MHSLSRLTGTIPLGVLLAVAGLPSRGSAQEIRLEYPVKFVCGTRVPNPHTPFDAVARGVYFTAINIHNATNDTIQIATRFATTVPDPVGGPLLTGPNLRLNPSQALELDCQEILESARAAKLGVRFLKGFVILAPTRELDVVAVYTAGPNGEVATMEVERVIGRRWSTARDSCDCPDLVVGVARRPTYTPDHHTVVRVPIGNVGCVDATNVEVYMEDPSHTGPDRIVTTTIGVIPAGGVVEVSLELPYEVQGNANMAALVILVDPKNSIRECREDNNRRTVGSP